MDGLVDTIPAKLSQYNADVGKQEEGVEFDKNHDIFRLVEVSSCKFNMSSLLC